MFQRHDDSLRAARSEDEFEFIKKQNEKEFSALEERFRTDLVKRDQAVIEAVLFPLFPLFLFDIPSVPLDPSIILLDL